MSERSYGDSNNLLKIGVSLSVVLNLECKDSIDIRESELGVIKSLAVVLKCCSYIGIEHDVLELNVISVERNPLVSIPFLNHNRVFDFLLDCV